MLSKTRWTNSKKKVMGHSVHTARGGESYKTNESQHSLMNYKRGR